jgi:hypothetical protein
MKKLLVMCFVLLVTLFFASAALAQEKTAPSKIKGAVEEGASKVDSAKTKVKAEAPQKLAPGKVDKKVEAFPKVEPTDKMQRKINAADKMGREKAASTPEAPQPPKK